MEHEIGAFWTVFVQGTNGGSNYQHDSITNAVVEAKRLANLPENIGKHVYVMEVVGYHLIPQPPDTWHLIDKIPF